MRKISLKLRLSRVSFFYIAIGIAGAIFCARLFYLQIVRHDYYKAQALSEHQVKFTIPAQRGEIYALDAGTPTPLVLNENRPTVYADQRFITDPEPIAVQLRQILGGSKAEYIDLLSGESAYQVIAKKITRKQAQAIEKADMNGVGLSDVPYRVYPEEGLASQTLGFVNNEGEGQYGVEEYLQSQLRGEDGQLKSVADVYGIPLATGDDNVVKPKVDGKAVTLTIDINIQRFVERALRDGVKSAEARSGSAIVIDPNSGAIKAMANHPSYNAANYQSVTDYQRFLNPVANSAYEAGSVVKSFTMSAGLNEGAVTPQSKYTDSGSRQVDGETIENAGGDVVGTITMAQVIELSVNTGVMHVLAELGGGEINQRARSVLHKYFTEKFGFGNKVGIAQSNEAAGFISPVKTGAGDNVRYANMAFGQGMTVTMLQVAAAYSSVVNGGDYYKPYLIHGIGSDSEQALTQPQVIRKNVISAKTSRQMRSMMEGVVARGGGYSAQRSEYIIGGKTGTSQVIDQQTGEYSDYREVGSFLGFGAGKQPQYVIMTRVDEPGIPGYAGSVAAAPIFAEISNWLIDYYQIPPSR